MKKIKFRKTRNRLIFWFLLTYLLFFLLVIIIYSLHINFSIIEKEEVKLAAIRDMKVREIELFLNRISGDIEHLASRPAVRDAGYRLCSQNEIYSRTVLRDEFNSFIRNYDAFYEIFMIKASSGQVVYSSIGKNMGADRRQSDYLREPLRTGKKYISSIFFSKSLNIPTMTVSISLKKNGSPTVKAYGVLVMRIYLERTIFSTLLDKKGLGITGETVLTGHDGLLLNRLRGGSGFPLSVKLHDLYIRLGAKENKGTVICNDYRNRKVISAYGTISPGQWIVAVKQDISEIKEPFYDMVVMGGITFFVIGALLFTGIWFFSRDFSDPIYKLIRVVNRIKKGDFSFRLTSERNDEFRILYHSFNDMADLITSQLRIQQMSSDIIQVMVTTLNLEEFSRVVLHKLVESSHSVIGAFYILTKNGDEFKHLSSIGLDMEKIESFHAESLEGEFGRALATREITVTGDLASGNMVKVRSIAGDILPEEIITIPVVVGNRTMAIISLASVHAYHEDTLPILHQIRPVMNMALANIMADEETRLMARELSEKNQQLERKRKDLERQTTELGRQGDMVKAQNRELEIQHKKVEEANRLKTEFLSNMSHELRTPLNSIMALSRVLKLQAGENLSDEENDYIDVIERNGVKLLALINDILDLSRIESGRIDLKVRKLPLESIITMLLDNHEQIAEAKGIQLRSSFPGDLPMIESDESRVFQILQNIISNAVKFTEKGSVAVITEADDQELVVSVRDTGIGIEEESLPGIFEEFRQVDGTDTRKYEGTGLGLAIAARSAELIGASINVESAPGVGTTFTVRFPVRWPHEDEVLQGAITFSSGFETVAVDLPEEKKKESNGGSQKRARQGERQEIMIIDDDHDNITVVQAVLQDLYDVSFSYDGQEAMEMIREAAPDLILLDMSLPGKSGFIIARELKQEDVTRRVPVVALTALTMPGDRERILSAGCDDYIAKPYNIDLLKQKIEEWLQR